MPSVRKADYEAFAKAWWLLRLEARELRGVHREDLAKAIGYPSDQTGFISDIDNAKRLPGPEMLEKFVTCMELSFEDKSLLFDLAGYRFSRQVPELESIKQELAPIAEEFRTRRFPVIITDRRFALWVLNPAAVDFFGSFKDPDPTEPTKTLANQHLRHQDTQFTTVFDIYFNSSLPLRFIDEEHFLKVQIARFKNVNVGDQHRRFYMDYPECMKNRLQPADYSVFKKIWDETDATFEGRGHTKIQPVDAPMPLITVLSTIPIPGLNGFFEVTYFDPAADKTQNALNAFRFFPERSDVNQRCLALWDIAPADDLLRRYSQEYSEPWQIDEIVNRLEKRLKGAGIDIETERKKKGGKTGSLSEPQSQ